MKTQASSYLVRLYKIWDRARCPKLSNAPTRFPSDFRIGNRKISEFQNFLVNFANFLFISQHNLIKNLCCHSTSYLSNMFIFIQLILFHAYLKSRSRKNFGQTYGLDNFRTTCNHALKHWTDIGQAFSESGTTNAVPLHPIVLITAHRCL